MGTHDFSRPSAFMSDPAPVPAKPKRQPPRVDPLSPHGVRCATVGRLVSQESMKKPGAWPRELQILKRLQLRFADETFWTTLAPAERVDSLTYFIAPFGASQLQQHWNLHVFARSQEAQFVEERDARQNEIDSQSMSPMMESTNAPDQAKPAAKQSAVQWADS